MDKRSVKELIRDIDPDAYTKPKLSASKAERKTAKAARREEVNRRKAVQQEETSLIAMRVFEKLLARESRTETTNEGSQSKRASGDALTDSDCLREDTAKLMALTRLVSQSRASVEMLRMIFLQPIVPPLRSTSSPTLCACVVLP